MYLHCNTHAMRTQHSTARMGCTMYVCTCVSKRERICPVYTLLLYYYMYTALCYTAQHMHILPCMVHAHVHRLYYLSQIEQMDYAYTTCYNGHRPTGDMPYSAHLHMYTTI